MANKSKKSPKFLPQEVFVYVYSGVVYSTDDKNRAEAVLSPEEWNNLDKSLRYEIVDGTLSLVTQQLSEPPKEVLPPNVETYFEQNGAGLRAQVDTLWESFLTGDSGAVKTLQEKRLALQAEYQKRGGKV